MVESKIFKSFEKLFGFQKHSKLIDIDFNKPVWNIYKKLKSLLLGVVTMVFIKELIVAILPGILVFVISNQKFDFLIYILVLVFIIAAVFYLEYYLSAILLNKLTFSLHTSAQKFFLTTDPINQSTRSSGQIISKVERASNSAQTLAEVAYIDLFPMVISIFASVIPLYFFDFKIGFWLTLFIVLVITFNAYSRLYVVDKFQPFGIKSEDKFKAVAVENLSQVMLIRSVFSTENQIKKQSLNGSKAVSNWATVWHLLHTSDIIMHFLSYCSVVVLAWYLMSNPEIFSTTLAIALLTNYIFAINKVSSAGARIKKFAVNKANLEDLFSFIRNFGKQTYPVLDNDQNIYKN